MKLVVGLGNPGPRYERTRHNVGFLVLDELVRRWGGSFREKFKGLTTKAVIRGHEGFLVKPQTFMNLSGESVQAAAHFFSLLPSDIVVVHDELDLPLGAVRVKFKGGHGGHNGLRSIVQHCGAEFVRVRCGIGRPPKGDAVNWVLGGFGDEELPWVAPMVERAANAVETIAVEGLSAAMNRFNADT